MRTSLLLARAVRETLCAEELVVQKRIEEEELVLKVLRRKAKVAALQVNVAEEQIGQVHHNLNHHGITEVSLAGRSNSEESSSHHSYPRISSDLLSNTSPESDGEINSQQSPRTSSASLLTTEALKRFDEAGGFA